MLVTAEEMLKKAYNDEDVITLEDLPDLKTYPIREGFQMIQEEKRDHRKEENDPYKIKKKPKPFAPESSLMYYMTKAGWVIILNIVFLISCLPVFTIGTAVTSFYYAMMKSIRRDRSYPLLEYWSSFKRTFV